MFANENRLRLVLRVNAIFSTASGLVLILVRPLASLMQANSRTLIFIGIGLILFALTVMHAALRKDVSRKQVLSIVVQDWVWVVASLIVIALQAWQLSSVAYMLIGAVAVIVGLFASLQLKFLGTKT